jgi:hypothetical protein
MFLLPVTNLVSNCRVAPPCLLLPPPGRGRRRLWPSTTSPSGSPQWRSCYERYVTRLFFENVPWVCASLRRSRSLRQQMNKTQHNTPRKLRALARGTKRLDAATGGTQPALSSQPLPIVPWFKQRAGHLASLHYWRLDHCAPSRGASRTRESKPRWQSLGSLLRLCNH